MILITEPEGDNLIDDMPFAPKVMGRFDIGIEDNDFHQYGVEGVPFLQRDMDPWNKRERDVALAAANFILTERYGKYYTASGVTAE